ncbi:MAG: 2Fe-2S iron-sulfur cluster-binding protein [Paracoccaceae bacterium]|nr:2Fe-2S iron-sulfur cluster-binding protein [Paracoccaceae bacterium]MDG2259285.1 2Fe-2S iron-sulfur cluster-binding protein [Paracoccaceae bacterium]
MARFHELTVSDVNKTIRDAVIVTLAPKPEDSGTFLDYLQGQYLTFRKDFDGEELRRSYSICAGKDDGVLQVGIKRVDGGAFSTWVNEDLKAGDVVEAMPPMGAFHTPIEPDKAKNYLGFAGGSGVTPILSILKTVLSREAKSTFTLVYANKTVSSIMFREQLEDLKSRYMNRLSIIHILEQDAQDIDLFTGLVTGEKCDQLFEHWIDINAVDLAMICGPESMMLGIRDALQKHSLTKDQIKFELFASAQTGRAKRRAQSSSAINSKEATAATVRMDGEIRSFEMSKNQTILEAALENNMDAPHACKAGVCSTCMCRVVEGQVDMVTNHALEDYEVEKGYVLSCQSYPISSNIVVDFES